MKGFFLFFFFLLLTSNIYALGISPSEINLGNEEDREIYIINNEDTVISLVITSNIKNTIITPSEIELKPEEKKLINIKFNNKDFESGKIFIKEKSDPHKINFLHGIIIKVKRLESENIERTIDHKKSYFFIVKIVGISILILSFIIYQINKNKTKIKALLQGLDKFK